MYKYTWERLPLWPAYIHILIHLPFETELASPSGPVVFPWIEAMLYMCVNVCKCVCVEKNGLVCLNGWGDSHQGT